MGRPRVVAGERWSAIEDLIQQVVRDSESLQQILLLEEEDEEEGRGIEEAVGDDRLG